MGDSRRGGKLVEHFIVAVKHPDSGPLSVEMQSCYPEGGPDERDFCRSVAMFMFPHGFGSDAWDRRSLLPPPPTHHVFALTDVRGDRLFGASLCFFEAAGSPASSSPTPRRSSRKPSAVGTSNNNDEDASSAGETARSHAGKARKSVTAQHIEPRAKAICLLSRRPLYTGLLRYLEQLLLLGLRQSHVSSCAKATGSGSSPAEPWPAVEKTLCNLFHEVPAPLRGLAVQVTVADTELVLEREMPFDMDAELMTLAFTALEPPLLARLVLHALLEHRVLVVVGSNSASPSSSDGIVATAVVETLRSLLCPFPWLHVSVPSVPDAVDLPTLLEAPVPFIAGAHASQLAGLRVPSNVVKLEFVGGRFVLDEGRAAADGRTTGDDKDAGDVELPPLPAPALDLLVRLSAARLPDPRTRKKELHQRLWDRRIHLQKSCLLATATATATAAAASASSSSSATTKSVFLVRTNMLYRKMMRQFLELTAALLDGFTACVSPPGGGGSSNNSNNNSNQPVFDQERFLQIKPPGERVFYRQLARTAHFQAFMAQYQDYLVGALPADDAGKIQFVLHRLLRSPITPKSSSPASALSSLSSSLPSFPILSASPKGSATAVTSPTAGAFATSKTFVAQTPSVPPLPEAHGCRRQSVEHKRVAPVDGAGRRPSTTAATAWGRFPDIHTASFGRPRDVAFPQPPPDAATCSFGTLVPKRARFRRTPSSKDAGMEWMQQLLQSVSSSIKRLDTPAPGDKSQQPLPAGPQRAPFTRSRTIDRIGSASTRAAVASSPTATGFYRTLTQRDTKGDSASSRPAKATLHRFQSMRSPELRSEWRQNTKLASPGRLETTTVTDESGSAWLGSTSDCGCSSRVAELTRALVTAQRQAKQRASESDDRHGGVKALKRVAVASSELIDALGDCGHPGEAKAVFEECLASFSQARRGDSAPTSLETIADSGGGGAWRAFSALVRCYVRNGLVQRAFDLLAQVKVRDEKMLDPSLGVLGFSARVVSAERQVVLQRVYATFSAGNLGLALGARNSVADSGCVVLSTGNHAVDKYSLAPGLAVGGQQRPSSVVEPSDVVETINGEMVLHYPFPTIVARLKRAHRPMTVTLLRGMAKATSLHAWCQELSGDRASVTEPSEAPPPATAADPQSLDAGARPAALCDRFGLLPASGIRLRAVADCAACGARASLADIQAGWSMTDENDYTTRCARCGRRFVPRLSVEMARCGQEQSAAGVDVQVEYLSTLVVRKELANLAQKLPLPALSMAELRARNPRIYWNVVVKLLALACPLDFMELPGGVEAADRGSMGGDDRCEGGDQGRESVSSDASASCATEPPPLTDEDDPSGSDDDKRETEHAEQEDSDAASNNNSEDEDEDEPPDATGDDMDALERAFLAAVSARVRAGGGGESLDDVGASVLALLQRRVAGRP